MNTLLKLVGVNCRWGCRMEILGPPMQAVPTVNVSVHARSRPFLREIYVHGTLYCRYHGFKLRIIDDARCPGLT